MPLYYSEHSKHLSSPVWSKDSEVLRLIMKKFYQNFLRDFRYIKENENWRINLNIGEKSVERRH